MSGTVHRGTYFHSTGLFSFDAELEGPWLRRHRVSVDGTGFRWDGTRVEFDDIASVGYCAGARAFNVLQHGIRRDVVVSDHRGPLRLVLDDTGSTVEDLGLAAYAHLIEALHIRVEPRLVATMVAEIAIGRTVAIGGVEVSGTGLGINRRLRRPLTVEWAQIPLAELDGTNVMVSAIVDDERRLLADIPMLAPNAVLLPELFSLSLPIG